MPRPAQGLLPSCCLVQVLALHGPSPVFQALRTQHCAGGPGQSKRGGDWKEQGKFLKRKEGRAMEWPGSPMTMPGVRYEAGWESLTDVRILGQDPGRVALDPSFPTVAEGILGTFRE